MLIICVSQGTVIPRLHNISIKYAFFLRFLHECTRCHGSLFASQNKQYGASDPWSDLTSGTNAGFKNLPPAFGHGGPSRLDLARCVRVTVPIATGRHSLIRVTNGAGPFSILTPLFVLTNCFFFLHSLCWHTDPYVQLTSCTLFPHAANTNSQLWSFYVKISKSLRTPLWRWQVVSVPFCWWGLQERRELMELMS